MLYKRTSPPKSSIVETVGYLMSTDDLRLAHRLRRNSRNFFSKPVVMLLEAFQSALDTGDTCTLETLLLRLKVDSPRMFHALYLLLSVRYLNGLDAIDPLKSFIRVGVS